MEHSPCLEVEVAYPFTEPEASFLILQEFALIYILSQMNPVYVLTSKFPKIHFNITLRSNLFPSGFPTTVLHTSLISSLRTRAPFISISSFKNS
jgi:hypothetical protein